MKLIAGRQHFILLLVSLLAGLLVACSPAPRPTDSIRLETVTAEDYQRAEQLLAANTTPLVLDNILAQYWQSEDRLVYKKSTTLGSDYVIVDPASNMRELLFDQTRLAVLLAEYTEEPPEGNDLDLSRIVIAAAQPIVEFDFEGSRYSINLNGYALQQLERAPANEFASPDGSKAAFIEDYNLWLRDTATNTITQLTFDGEQDYGYATNNAGWIRSDGPVLLWSPDSRKIATFRHDGREVGEMYLYNTQVGHPELDAWKYPLPGDDSIFVIERIVIHLGDQPRVVRLNMPPDPHRSTTSDHVAGRGGIFLDVEWSEDSGELAFVSSSRDHKVAQLRVADIETGAVRDVFREETASYFESGFNAANWRVWHDRNEFIWFSEADNWGHLYLHDLASGQLKQQLTTGSWAVLQIQRVDPVAEQIYFSGSNREPGDPYYQYLYRIDFDGNNLVNLTPEPANHVISWSQSAQYFTDIYSTPTQAARAVIRDNNGLVVAALEEADISALLDSGWSPPSPFTVKARDQQTDLYGLMYRPSNLDETLSYPVLNYLYPGPQTGSVGSRSFQASRADKQALAELGFIVVEVDAMGTPGRSKSFHDAYYGNMGDNGLPDQISAIRQLAERHPWMDLDRVGIWGHSGGGFASTAAILRYPDFYKVAVSGAGNHDNRNYEDDWGEKWQGLLETYPETNPTSEGDAAAVAATNYDNQANQLLADQLQGKLLLAHGMMDTNVHPSSTLLVVEALIEAEKDFDLLVLPNAGHGFGNRRYFMKRRWDYFVEHLKDLAPPAEFRFADNIR
ncbi:MAG: DPP IV N-terminal domain-containing protein [Gammaproteobacteria bacterium]|jgi:dipeptidyl aminopeptidase/acylaminoacyl peptidase|nr:DPP IV N-terminal domain-containing protein [Gammaproteobacteria bacterium]MDP6731862.1 DPP IV N-terminal domain-containing protein [Gammaproteobacteria bacterium]